MYLFNTIFPLAIDVHDFLELYKYKTQCCLNSGIQSVKPAVSAVLFQSITQFYHFQLHSARKHRCYSNLTSQVI